MTPTQVPMLDPDGNAGMVPHDRVEDAIKSGGQIGFHIQAPDGSLGVVPAAKVSDALKSGGKIYQQPQPTNQQIDSAVAKPATPDPGFLHGAWEQTFKPLWDEAAKQKGDLDAAPDFGAKLHVAVSHALKNTPEAMGTQMISGIVKSAYQEGRKSVSHAAAAVRAGANGDGQEMGREISQAQGHGLAAIIPGVGPAAADAGEDIAAGRPREGLGKATALIGTMLLGGKGGRAAATEGEAMETAAAAKKLTNAVNPLPKEMPKFQASLEKQLPRIVDHAERNGIELTSREKFLQALRGAADEHQELYNKQLLEPIKDKPVVNPETGTPQGQTYGEAEARLRHLNRTTDYSPTTAAESEAQLARKAEARSLRGQLNDSIAKELGLEPEQVAEARASGEELRGLADKTEYSMDVERFSRNASQRGGVANLHATPHGAYATTGGRVSSAVNRGVEKLIGHPGDNAVRDVFRSLKSEKPKLAKPNAPKPESRPPLTDQQRRAAAGAARDGRAPGSTSTIGENVELSRQYQTQRAAQRASQRSTAASTRELESATDEAVKQHNAAAHGKYKATSDALGKTEWPEKYRNAPKNTSRNNAGGANYTAEELAAFKKKHNL